MSPSIAFDLVYAAESLITNDFDSSTNASGTYNLTPFGEAAVEIFSQNVYSWSAFVIFG